MSPNQIPTEPKYTREMEDASVGVSSSEPAVEGEDEIDEFIKKHLDDDEEEAE